MRTHSGLYIFLIYLNRAQVATRGRFAGDVIRAGASDRTANLGVRRRRTIKKRDGARRGAEV